MKKLLALCSFGLILWLAATQANASLSSSDSSDETYKIKNHRMKSWSGDIRHWSGMMMFGSGERKCPPELSSWDDCVFGSGGMMPRIGSGKLLSGEMKWWPRLGSWSSKLYSGSKSNQTTKNTKSKKIFWNEFNDDLNKILKFLDTDLTSTQKKEAWTILSDTRSDLKVIYSEIKSKYQSGTSIDMTWYIDTLTDEFNNLSDELDEYIDADKQDEFDSFISNKISNISKNLQSKMKVKR